MIIPESFRILVTGVTSIHGWPVFKALEQCVPLDRLFGIRPPKMHLPEGDHVRSVCITDRKALLEIKNKFKPTHVVHCSGVCDLDVCEERPEWAASLNTLGTKAIADVFGNDSHIIYLSTDLVFSGNNPPENGYFEESPVDPVSVAGKTFACAEDELARSSSVCIVRLGLPIGESITGDKGAVGWINSRFKKGRPVTLFHDEYRSVIGCDLIADIVLFLLATGTTGLFHCGGPEPVSLFEVGEYVRSRGGYPAGLLNAISRFDEKDGPPRIGRVALNSTRLAGVLNLRRADLCERLTKKEFNPCLPAGRVAG